MIMLAQKNTFVSRLNGDHAIHIYVVFHDERPKVSSKCYQFNEHSLLKVIIVL